MVKHKHQFLTESERAQIMAIPIDRDRFVRLYTFRAIGHRCPGMTSLEPSATGGRYPITCRPLSPSTTWLARGTITVDGKAVPRTAGLGVTADIRTSSRRIIS